MGEIGNQEQTIGDSGDDWPAEKTLKEPTTRSSPSEWWWCVCVRVKSGVPRVQSRSRSH